jgi:hypothetical protein
MPIYYGCPNAEDYFPPESFIRVDVNDVDAAAETIRRAIRDDAWKTNLPAILESRRRVLEEYGPIATVVRLVNERHVAGGTRASPPAHIRSRRHLHRQLLPGVRYGLEKLYVRARNRLAGN